MNKRTNYWFSALIAVASVGVATWAYPRLPQHVVSHWGLNGMPNGYMSAAWAAFLFPVIIAVLAIILSVLPLIDPKGHNIKKFEQTFHLFVTGILVFLLYVQVLVMYWNIVDTFDMVRFITPGVALLFIGVSYLIRDSEPNWFIGIRTPWTMESPEVWRRTSEVGANLFVGAGIISLFGVIFPAAALWLILAPVLVAALGSVVYSYVIFEQLKTKKR
jgi:uncharacterized membrane protein